MFKTISKSQIQIILRNNNNNNYNIINNDL